MQWKRSIGVAFGLCLLASPSLADEDLRPDQGRNWQHGHMSSHYVNLTDRPDRRVIVEGGDRYDQLREGTDSFPTRPAETIEASQRQWKQGPLVGASPQTSTLPAVSSGPAGTQGGRGGKPPGARSGSAGANSQLKGPNRGSGRRLR